MQASKHSAPHTPSADQLVEMLHRSFDYTSDNNRDLLGDTTFSLGDCIEELEVERSYQFLIAYIARNTEMIESNLQD